MNEVKGCPPVLHHLWLHLLLRAAGYSSSLLHSSRSLHPPLSTTPAPLNGPRLCRSSWLLVKGHVEDRHRLWTEDRLWGFQLWASVGRVGVFNLCVSQKTDGQNNGGGEGVKDRANPTGGSDYPEPGCWSRFPDHHGIWRAWAQLAAAPPPGGPKPRLPGPAWRRSSSVGPRPGLPHHRVPVLLAGGLSHAFGAPLLHQAGARLGGFQWPPPPGRGPPLRPQRFHRPLLGTVHGDRSLQVRDSLRAPCTSVRGPQPGGPRGSSTPPPAPQQDVQQPLVPGQLCGDAASDPQPDRWGGSQPTHTHTHTGGSHWCELVKSSSETSRWRWWFWSLLQVGAFALSTLSHVPHVCSCPLTSSVFPSQTCPELVLGWVAPPLSGSFRRRLSSWSSKLTWWLISSG